ncbi:MAG TPA: hypothetical protein VLF43_01395 [Candidatus Saccharimonadales bacterium]|nr:hypothetical protein [Candidatus Saccharimonadales bacterium]
MAAVIAAEVAVGELVSDEGASGEKDEALVRANTYKMGVLASRTAIRAGTDYNLDPPDARQAIAISDNLEELARIMEEANRAIGAPHRGV